jgi:hypothetical protein
MGMVSMKRCKVCREPKPLTAFYRDKSYADGSMSKCRQCHNASGAHYFREHRAEIMAKKPERDHRYAWHLRQKVLAHCGNQCVCCGETCIYFLQITHPAGKQAPHVQEIGYVGGDAVCRYLKKYHFPATYRILCGNCLRAYGSFRFCLHQEHDPRDMTVKNRQQRWELRLAILAAYGGRCTCCNDTSPYFLAIDHPNGEGGQHRRSLGMTAGQVFYRYLTREGFPQGYRLLCSNCHTARGWYGFCPHAEEPPVSWQAREHDLATLGRRSSRP